MHNNQIIKYLKTLSKNEVNQFGRFLEANSNKGPNDVKSLYQYLKKQHPLFKGPKMERAYVAHQVFKNPAKEMRKLDNAKLDLRKLLEQFLVQEEVKSQQKEYDFLLLNALRKRELDSYFFKKIEKIEKEWDNTPSLGIQHLYDVYRLKEMEIRHPNYDFKKAINTGPQAQLKRLEQYYVAMKLYWTLSELNTNTYFNNKEKDTEWPIIAIEPILEKIKSQPISIPQIDLLGQILSMFIDKDFEHYPKLKEKLLEYFDIYTKNEKNSLISFLSKISYEKYLTGDQNFLQELFELKRLIIEEKLLISNGAITNHQFIEIVNIASVSKQLEWTENFINNYIIYIKEEERADVKKLSKAILYFEMKDYEQVLEELVELHFHNVLIGVQARAIKLKAYYELEDYYDSFSSLIISFGSLFSRKITSANSLATNQKEAFSNFIKLTNKLYKNKNLPQRDKKHLDFKSLEEEILSAKPVYQNWLLEKVQEL